MVAATAQPSPRQPARQSRVMQSSFDDLNRMVQMVQDAGAPDAVTSTMDYDGIGNLTASVQGQGSSAAVTMTYAYDSLNRVTEATQAAGTPFGAPP